MTKQNRIIIVILVQCRWHGNRQNTAWHYTFDFKTAVDQYNK